MPTLGEMDIEVDLLKDSYDTPNKVMLTATFNGKNQEQVPLDLASLPPALEFSGALLSCKPRDCSGEIDVMASAIQAYLPPGTTLQLGTSKVTADATKSAKGPVTLTPAPKDALLSKVCSTTKTTLGTMPATLTFPDKTTATTTFTLDSELVRTKLITMLEGVKKGPVKFAWETTGAARGRAAVIMASSYCNVAGPADATLKDVHVVVFEEDKATRSSTCNYRFDDGTTGSANITMHDQLVTAYDRTTGKVIATKVFDAKKDCNVEVTTKNRNFTDQSAYPSFTTVAAWAASIAR
jgi:hypothetical protein